MGASRRSDASLTALAGYFRLLSEPARLKILLSLEAKERSVLEIVADTGLKQAHVSRQLAQLHGEGLLSRRKEGTKVYYALKDRRLPALLAAAEGFLRKHLKRRLGDLA